MEKQLKQKLREKYHIDYVTEGDFKEGFFICLRSFDEGKLSHLKNGINACLDAIDSGEIENPHQCKVRKINVKDINREKALLINASL